MKLTREEIIQLRLVCCMIVDVPHTELEARLDACETDEDVETFCNEVRTLEQRLVDEINKEEEA